MSSFVRRSPYLQANIIAHFGYNPYSQLTPNNLVIKNDSNLQRVTNQICSVCQSAANIRNCQGCYIQTCSNCLVQCQRCGDYICPKQWKEDEQGGKICIRCIDN